jgi:hypothetical protein
MRVTAARLVPRLLFVATRAERLQRALHDILQTRAVPVLSGEYVVRSAKSREARFEKLMSVGASTRAAHGLRRQRLQSCERTLDPVVQLIDQKRTMLLGLHAFGDIAHDTLQITIGQLAAYHFREKFGTVLAAHAPLTRLIGARPVVRGDRHGQLLSILYIDQLHCFLPGHATAAIKA